MSTETTTPSSPPEKPGRYQRSFGGLVVSVVVVVVALGALYAFTGLFRETTEFEPEDIDYLASVAAAQDSGVKAVYPAELPDGWTATGVDLDPADTTTFGLRLLTDDDRFVGIQQEEGSVTGLVTEWVDPDATETDDYLVPDSVSDPVAVQWAGYEDEGGDTGYVADLGKVTVLVYGSAPPEDLQQVVDLLTRAPVEG
ncbi:DUF4245 family protein [Nocardioides sambongensis]|uniref:DUF4245 family protein n=1 Tax=Nocardioides sambongensis TaxID=2589074 RepID=UPI0015E83285|nr:DUF4245 family protein [Nocardioides sambongensis]